MDYLSIIGIVFITHLLAVMSPGPDFVLVLRNAVQYNRKTAIWTSFGIASGIGIHIIYSVAGVAYLLKTHENAFNIIKYLGAIYLIYLGIKSLLEQHRKISFNNHQRNKNMMNRLDAVKTGFLTNILNPKASLFFLSLFSVVIPPNVPKYILIVISIMLISVTFLWFGVVSILFTQEKINRIYEKYENIFSKSLGVLLVILGISIALA